MDDVDVDEIVADGRVTLLEVVDVLVVKDVAQLEEVLRLVLAEKVVVFLEGFFGVFDHLILCHEGAQTKIAIEALQMVCTIEIDPIVSFLWIVL